LRRPVLLDGPRVVLIKGKKHSLQSAASGAQSAREVALKCGSEFDKLNWLPIFLSSFLNSSTAPSLQRANVSAPTRFLRIHFLEVFLAHWPMPPLPSSGRQAQAAVSPDRNRERRQNKARSPGSVGRRLSIGGRQSRAGAKLVSARRQGARGRRKKRKRLVHGKALLLLAADW